MHIGCCLNLRLSAVAGSRGSGWVSSVLTITLARLALPKPKLMNKT